MKFISLVCVAALVCAVACYGANDGSEENPHGKCGEGVTWNINKETGLFTIEGNGMMDNYHREPPPYYEYYNLNLIREIVVKDGVQSIGDQAFAQLNFFYREYPVPLTVEGNLKYLGIAFCTFSSICNVTFEGSVEVAGFSAFAGYDEESILKNITIKGSFNPLNETTFVGSFALENIEIGSSSSIGNATFFEAVNLKSVKIGSLNGAIEEDAFRMCSNLTTVDIGGTVTYIGSFAFSDCPSLKYANLPPTFENISEYAFTNCTSLIGFYIPETVKVIGERAFSNCSNLTTVFFGGENDLGSDDAFEGCDKLEEVLVSEKYKSDTFCGKKVKVVILPKSSSSAHSGTPSQVSSASHINTFVVNMCVSLFMLLSLLIAQF